MAGVKKPHLSRRAAGFLMGVLPLALGLLAYLNALGNGFAGDDHEIIVNFPLIREMRNLPAFFAMQDTLADGGATGYYRPLGRLVYMLDYHLWGLRPFGYHLVNLVLHLATTWGWYLLVKRLAGNWAALAAAAFFAVAPVNVESVAFISARNNIQVACLLVFSLYAHLRADDEDGRRNRLIWAGLSLFFYTLALFTKEFAVFFPFLLLAVRFMLPDLPRERGWRGHLGRLAPYLLLATLYLVIRATVIGHSHPLFASMSSGSLADSVRSIATYLRLLLFPLELSVTHDIAYGNTLLNIRGMVAIAVVVLLAAAYAATWRRDRKMCFFFTWFLLFLFPVCGILAFNPVPVAERYLYVGSLGAYTVMALAAEHLARRWQTAVVVVLGLYVAFFAARTVLRNADWHDDLTVALSTVKVRPDSPVAYYQLGSAYLAQGQNRQAMEAYSRSVALNPSFPHARMNLARVYHLEGMLDEAIREYLISLEVMPDNAQLHMALADAYYQKGMLTEAARHLKETLAIVPDNMDARHNLTLVEEEIRRAGEAR